VLCCDSLGPALHRGPSNLNGNPALPTHQMVVVSMTLSAVAVQSLSVGVDEDIDLADLRHRLKSPIHRREADVLASVTQDLVKLLR
jgi:hypothetical protein